MNRYRSKERAAAVSLIAFGILGSLVAFGCSDDSPGDNPPATTGDSDAAANDDAAETGQPVDGSVLDAGFDARPYDEPVNCEVSPCVTAIAAQGGAHVCALLSDKSVRCWGDNRSGQLGSLGSPSDPDAGPEPYLASPTVVPGIANATQISARGNDLTGTSCARLEDGSAMCWGANDTAQLGSSTGAAVPDSDPHPTPTRVMGIPAVRRVDLGGGFACAIEDTGDARGGGAYCWGVNSALQLGRGQSSTSDFEGADHVALGPVRVIRSAGTARNAFALSDQADLFSWGGNAWSSWDPTQRDTLGRESSLSPDGTPAMLVALPGVTAMAASDLHACAISMGQVYCWGVNSARAIDPASTLDARWPVQILVDRSKLASVFVSHRGTCVTSEAGEAICWGDGPANQLGNADAGLVGSPLAVALPGHVVHVAMMDEATCALVRDGSVYCWGHNTHGELARGSADENLHSAAERVTF